MDHKRVGSKWHNCLRVRTAKEEIGFYESQELTQLISFEMNKYMHENPNFAKDEGIIWFDLKNKFCFGSAQYKSWKGTSNLPPKDHSYFCPRTHFTNWSDMFIAKAFRENEIFKKDKIIKDSDFFIGYPEFMKKFKNKTIMIVGAGPSSKSVKWENINFDYLWSINKFYLNKKVSDIGVDLATIASHIDILNDDDLKEYIKKNNTIISFELERGNVHSEKYKYKEMADFSKLFPDQTTFFHTRYKSQPGVGMRLICYAILAGCKDIYFVGIDGFTAHGPLHSFETGKGNPNWYKNYGNDFQIRQYITFWDYLLKLKERFDYNIYNLGEDCRHNVSAAITKQVCPLTDEIRAKIK